MTTLKSITVENYRAFRGKHTIDLGKLTLLFGYNNTGKSALIRLFPLLRDSFKKDEKRFYTSSYLDYSSPSIRGALFDKIVTDGERKLSISLQWHDREVLAFSLRQSGLDPEEMTSLKIVFNDGTESEYQRHLDNPEILEKKDSLEERISFYNFRLPNNEQFNKKIESFSNSIYWISSLRKHPPRSFEIGLGIKIELSEDGDGIGPLLWSLHKKNSPSLEDINNWLYSTCGRVLDFTNSLSVSNGRQLVSLETIPKEHNENNETIKIPILDSGEGIAQALPVVVSAAMASNNELGDSPIIVIEQPELHLHPQASVELAKFIAKCMNKNEKCKFVLETHSESFLRSLQIEIIKNNTSPDDVSCYWVTKSDNSSEIRKVTLDKNGYVSNNWPQDVFRENLKLSKEIIDLRTKKGISP